MTGDPAMSPYLVAVLAATIGGAFTLLGVWLATRWTNRYSIDEDMRVERRTADEKRWETMAARIDQACEDITEIRERLAGIEAVMMYLHPSLGQRAPGGRQGQQ